MRPFQQNLALLTCLALALSAASACTQNDVEDPGGDSGPQQPADSDAPGDTDTTGTPVDTNDTSDTEVPDDTDDSGEPVEVFDCSTVPELPEPETIIKGAKGEKGLAFDDEGRIVGSDGDSLIKATYDGDWELWIPGAGDVEGLAYLSGGDLISTYGYGSGEVKRYTPEGGQTTLVAGLNNYSVAIGSNDMIYAAGWNGAFIIDPDTGEYRKLYKKSPKTTSGVSPRSLAFSKDYRKLYVGTIDSSGRIYTIDLDEDLLPAGDPQLFAEGVGHGWHDGIGIDICGNVYAVDYASSSLYRVSADGKQVDKLVDWSENSREFAHGLSFGSGIGGWRIDALYLPEPQNDSQVKEIVLGVPGNRWEGKVINGT